MQSQMEPVTLKGTQQQGGAMTSLVCDNIGILATRDLAYILCVRVCVYLGCGHLLQLFFFWRSFTGSMR